MKNFPNQFNDLQKFRNALAAIRDLYVDGVAVENDGLLGRAFARRQIYTFPRHGQPHRRYLPRNDQHPRRLRLPQVTLSRLLLPATLLLFTLLAACDDDTFSGTGPVETRTFDLNGFTELHVSHGFTVRATASIDFSVPVGTNVEVFGDRLILAVEPYTRLDNTRLDNTHLDATITAPDLSGASGLLLAGQTDLLILDASGARDGAAEALTVDRARIDLTGANSASLTATTLTERAALSGASSFVYGGGTIADHSTSGAYSITAR